jgi:hypothetical protein
MKMPAAARRSHFWFGARLASAFASLEGSHIYNKSETNETRLVLSIMPLDSPAFRFLETSEK